MKISKWFLQLILCAGFFVAGAVCMHVWDSHQARQDRAFLDTLNDTDSLLVTDMQQATVPEDATELQAPQSAQPITVPSQLSKIDVPEVQAVFTRSGHAFEPVEEPGATPAEKPDASLVKLDDSAVVGGQAQRALAAQTPQEESKISMIEAPVEALLIKSMEEYRAFKRRARGSYPEVNFAKENVLVLESAGNLPDKVFEIQTVADADGKRIVTYRVSVFGLDKKINTHSVKVIDKKDLPLELKQVL